MASPALFLQRFMWKKICSFTDVRKLYEFCTECETFSLDDLQVYVEAINRELKPLHMKIAKTIHEITGEHYYALINQANNSITRLSTLFTNNELELLKKIVENIITSEDGKLDSGVALNLTSELPCKMSKHEAEEVINKFSRKKWLCEEDGEISLSPLCILELGPYMRSTYKEWISLCSICKEIVLQSVSCSHCGEKLHHHCKEKYFEGMSRKLCPVCGKEWKQLQQA